MYLYDMTVHQYETFQQQVALVTVDGDIINLNGKRARAQVRPSPNSSELKATMSCSVNAGKGSILFSLTPAQTSSIPVGKYYYDLCIEEDTPNGLVRQYLIGGKFTVYPSVTR